MHANQRSPVYSSWQITLMNLFFLVSQNNDAQAVSSNIFLNKSVLFLFGESHSQPYIANRAKSNLFLNEWFK